MLLGAPRGTGLSFVITGSPGLGGTGGGLSSDIHSSATDVSPA
jgi:hypothetical protein